MNDPLDDLYAKALPGFLNPKDSVPPPPVHAYDWSVWSKEELMELVRVLEDDEGIAAEVMREITGVN